MASVPRTHADHLPGVLLLAVLSCSPPPTPFPPELSLATAPDATEVGPDRLVARLEPDQEWGVRGTDSRLVEMAEKRVLVLDGAERIGVLVPGPLEPGFDRVVLEFRSEGRCWFDVRALRGGETVLSSEPRPIESTHTAHRYVIDFPEAGRASEAFDGIRIGFSAPRGVKIGLAAVDLVDRPLARWVAVPEQEPVLIRAGTASRRGWVVTTERPLVGEIDLEPGEYVASLSASRPKVPVPPGGPAQLRFEVEGEGFSRSIRSPVKHRRWDERVTPAFRVERPTRARVRLSLEREDELPAACAVAEVRIRPRRPAAPKVPVRTVVLVTSDTHRGDYLGAAGAVDVATPALDALATRGVLFEDCWSSTNITNPSHIALMTGLSPRDTGVVTNTVPLGGAAHTLAEVYRAEGFVTWAVVSVTNLGHDGSGLGQGFDRIATPPSGPVGDAAEAVDRALAWLPDAEGRPLFLWVHVFDAHVPYGPPAGYDRRYYPDDRDPFDEALGAPPVPPGLLPESLRGVRDLAYPEAQYRGEVSYLDAELGRLLSHPRLRDGVIAVTADHGEALGEHETYYDHVLLYPHTLHVPLILAGPDVPRGRRIAAPARQMDVARTLLDLSGLVRVDFPGENLLERGEEPSPPRYLLAAQGNAAAIQRGDDYLILHLTDHREHQSARRFERHQVELYDLANDPGCLRELSAERFDRARELRAELVQWLAAPVGSELAGTASTDPAKLAELAALGYVSHESTLAAGRWWQPDGCARCAPFE